MTHPNPGEDKIPYPFLLGACAAFVFIVLACALSTAAPASTQPPTFTQTPTITPTPTLTPTPTSTPAILVGAGDIAICGNDGDMQTASLLDSIPGAIFTAGDNSNQSGTIEQYRDCFGPSWGRFLDRLHPSEGNHDYNNKDDSAYYQYFGSAAAEQGRGYYSFNLDGWHIAALNSNCSKVDCRIEGEQLTWLKADLEGHPNLCTLAYFHHPRWNSGTVGNDEVMSYFWQVLYQYGVDVVVNGHEHHYERFAPQDPQGKADPQKGIREFVVGTGGVDHMGFGQVQPNSEVRDSSSFGVIKFSLYPDHYDWEFVPVLGAAFQDRGSTICH